MISVDLNLIRIFSDIFHLPWLPIVCWFYFRKFSLFT